MPARRGLRSDDAGSVNFGDCKYREYKSDEATLEQEQSARRCRGGGGLESRYNLAQRGGVDRSIQNSAETTGVASDAQSCHQRTRGVFPR